MVNCSKCYKCYVLKVTCNIGVVYVCISIRYEFITEHKWSWASVSNMIFRVPAAKVINSVSNSFVTINHSVNLHLITLTTWIYTANSVASLSLTPKSTYIHQVCELVSIYINRNHSFGFAKQNLSILVVSLLI